MSKLEFIILFTIVLPFTPWLNKFISEILSNISNKAGNMMSLLLKSMKIAIGIIPSFVTVASWFAIIHRFGSWSTIYNILTQITTSWKTTEYLGIGV